MRIATSKTASTNPDFAKNLLKIGNGIWPSNENNEIECDDTICLKASNMKELIENIYPNISTNYKNKAWISERVIITLRNDSVDAINEHILEQLPGKSRTYESIDTTVNEDEATLYPTEFLNSLDHSGIPQHSLTLKIGALIILMRNLNPPILCNGTKLIIVSLMNFIIEAEILAGPGST